MRRKRFYLDLNLLTPGEVRALKEMMYRQYARSTDGQDTSPPDVEFTDWSISAIVINDRRK